MRPVYFGSRRIAPVVNTARPQGREARTLIVELRPTQTIHEAEHSNDEEPQTLHKPAFVTQVISQFQRAPQSSAKYTAQSYEAASALGRYRGPWLSAII